MLTAAHVLHGETEEFGVAIEANIRDNVVMSLLRQLLVGTTFPEQPLADTIISLDGRSRKCFDGQNSVGSVWMRGAQDRTGRPHGQLAQYAEHLGFLVGSA